MTASTLAAAASTADVGLDGAGATLAGCGEAAGEPVGSGVGVRGAVGEADGDGTVEALRQFTVSVGLQVREPVRWLVVVGAAAGRAASR
jgi:hypothetical protein